MVAPKDEIEPECVEGRAVEKEFRPVLGPELCLNEAPDKLGRLILRLPKARARMSSMLAPELVSAVPGREAALIERRPWRSRSSAMWAGCLSEFEAMLL